MRYPLAALISTPSNPASIALRRRSRREVLDRGEDLRFGQRARGHEVAWAVVGLGLSRRFDSRRADRYQSVGQQARVADTAGVHELGKDHSALLVNGVCDVLPGRDLLGNADRGCRCSLARLSTAGSPRRRSVPRRRAPRNASPSPRSGGAGLLSTGASRRSHHDPVLQFRSGQVVGLEGACTHKS